MEEQALGNSAMHLLQWRTPAQIKEEATTVTLKVCASLCDTDIMEAVSQVSGSTTSR